MCFVIRLLSYLLILLTFQAKYFDDHEVEVGDRGVEPFLK